MPWRPSSWPWEIRHILQIKSVAHGSCILLNRYDVEGVADELFARCLPIVFFEPQLETHNDATLPTDADVTFAVEYLPGQYDQRAASLRKSASSWWARTRPAHRPHRTGVSAHRHAHGGGDRPRSGSTSLTPWKAARPTLRKQTTLRQRYAAPETVETLHGFTQMTRSRWTPSSRSTVSPWMTTIWPSAGITSPPSIVTPR